MMGGAEDGGGGREVDWTSSVSALHDALREAERQRRLATRSLEAVTTAKQSIEKELETVRKRERSAREARQSLEGQLRGTQQEVDRLQGLLKERDRNPLNARDASTATDEGGPWVGTESCTVGRGGLHQQQQQRMMAMSMERSGASCSTCGAPLGLHSRDISFRHVRGMVRDEGPPWTMMMRMGADEEENNSSSMCTDGEVQTIREGVHDLSMENERLEAENNILRQRLAVVEKDIAHSTSGYKESMQRQVLRRLCTTWQRKQEAAFYQWSSSVARSLHASSAHQHTRASAQMEKAVAVLASHSDQRLLSRSFGNWKHYVGERGLLRRVLTRFLRGKCLALMSRGWYTWRERVMEWRVQSLEGKFKETAEKIRTRLWDKMQEQSTRALLEKVWAVWSQFIRRNLRVKKLLVRWASRKGRSMVLHAWDKWRATIEQVNKSQAIMNRVLRRLSLSLLFKGLKTWQQHVRHMTQLDAHQEKQKIILDNQHKGLRLLERLMARLQRKDVSRAFRSWLQLLRDHHRAQLSKHKDAIIRRTIGRLHFLGVSKALASWKDFVSLRRWLRSLLSRILGNKSMSVKAAAFRRWREQAEWEDYAHRLLRRVVCKIANKVYEKTLRTWRYYVVSQQAEQMKDQHKLKVMRRFIQVWKERRALSAFRAWQEFVSMRRKLRAIFNRFGRDKRLRELDWAFDTWRRWLESEYIAALDGALTSTETNDNEKGEANNGKKKPMSPWQGCDTTNLSPKYRTLQVVTQKSQRLDRLEKMSSRLQAKAIKERDLRFIQRYFREWRTVCINQARLRTILRHWVTKKALATYAHTFSRWRTAVEKYARHRSIMLKILRRLDAFLLAKGFDGWRKGIEHLDNEAQEQKRKDDNREAACRLLRRVVIRAVNKDLAAAFRTWQRALHRQDREALLTALEKHREVIVRQVVNRLCHLSVVKCLNTWKDFVGRRIMLRSFLTRILGGKEIQCKAATLATWREHTLQQGKRIKAMEKVLLQLQKKALTKAMRTWYIFLLAHRAGEKEEKRQHAIVCRFVQLWRNRRSLAAFRGWLDYVARRRKARALLGHMTGNQRLVWEAKAFSTWKAKLHDARMLQKGLEQEMQSARMGGPQGSSAEGGERCGLPSAKGNYNSSWQSFDAMGGSGNRASSCAEESQLNDMVAERFIHYARSLAHSLCACCSLQLLLSVVVHKIPPLVQDAKCVLLLVDHVQRELWTYAENVGEIRFPLEDGLSGKAVATGTIVHVRDAWKDPAFNASIDHFTTRESGPGTQDTTTDFHRQEQSPVLEVIAVPVVSPYNDSVVGVLHVCKQRSSTPTTAVEGENQLKQDGRTMVGFAPRHLLVLQLCSALITMTLYRIVKRRGEETTALSPSSLRGLFQEGRPPASPNSRQDNSSEWWAVHEDLAQRLKEELGRAEPPYGGGGGHPNDMVTAIEHLLVSSVKLRVSNASLRERLRSITEYAGSLQVRLERAEGKVGKYKAKLLLASSAGTTTNSLHRSSRHRHHHSHGHGETDRLHLRDLDYGFDRGQTANSSDHHSGGGGGNGDDEEEREEDERLDRLYGILTSSQQPLEA